MMKLLRRVADDNAIGDLRPLPVPCALVAAAAFVILRLTFVGYVFPGHKFAPIRNATGGLVQPTLLANLTILAVVVFILACVGRQRPGDLGWSGSLRTAITGTVSVWLAINAIEAVLALSVGGPIWNRDWASAPAKLVGRWMAETVGTAFLEETLFRGVALRQIARCIGTSSWTATQRWSVALVLSQLLFAIMHIPLLVYVGAPVLTSLPGLFLAGAALAALYMVTRNLFLCVGVHGLADAPTLIVIDRLNLLESQYFAVLSCTALIAVALSLKKNRTVALYRTCWTKLSNSTGRP